MISTFYTLREREREIRQKEGKRAVKRGEKESLRKSREKREKREEGGSKENEKQSVLSHGVIFADHRDQGLQLVDDIVGFRVGALVDNGLGENVGTGVG
eukprot:1319020-Amorphochlora_amoeboformis.AAC.1